MTGQVGRVKYIDGKYELLRELSRQGNVTRSEVRSAEGATREVAWFEVATPADRQAFHAYRTALRSLNPAGLTDVVARPGAYYAVWQPVAGTPLSTFLAQKGKKPAETVEAIQALAARLAEHGYALADADVVLDGKDVRLAYLRSLSAARTPEDIAARNAQVLQGLNGGRVRRKREAGAWLTFVPGLLFLASAGYLGAQAAQIYLNPPVKEVGSVMGQDARAAAKKLTQAGFRVDYDYGQAGNQEIGTVIRQTPAAGTNLPMGRLVTLTVNNPPSIEVPRLEEMNVDQASDALKDRAMKLGKVVKVDGTLTNTAEGRIISQIPEAGSAAQAGQQVQVMVSTGVTGKETWLPNLTGLTYEQARDHARAAGLVVTKVKEQASDKPQNTVLDQAPAPYVRVGVGSPVTLVVAVARYSAPSRPTNNIPLPPPYVPPPVVQPENPTTPTTPTNPTTPEQPNTPTQPDNTTPTSPQNPTNTNEIPPAQQTSRSVTFRYVFPTDLPAGSYTVVVRDANGEREIMQATDAATLAGQVANATETVTGDAVFIIRQNGQDYATVTP